MELWKFHKNTNSRSMLSKAQLHNAQLFITMGFHHPLHLQDEVLMKKEENLNSYINIKSFTFECCLLFSCLALLMTYAWFL
ncbi:hypothetical protein Y1Q_0011266 [Alligator mississippiensis]|uniref:Uncharacterized protein n=1 Tax=Alligator mississippiensis TaxID=8496 RepID=A0A151N855_ALLMI|nr:hypothetical protein Y1Q_0011266 [Alligator mississippiensis]